MPLSLPNNSSNVYYEDDHILIRRYSDGDKESVRELFSNGIRSQIPLGIKLLSSSPFFGISALTSAWIVNQALSWLGKAAFSSSTFLILPRAETNHHQSSSTIYQWCQTLVVSATMLALNYVALSKCTTLAFEGYVQYSLKDDLSNIPAVYFVGNGNFYVAVDKQQQKEGRIVGCIGVQDMNTKQGPTEQTADATTKIEVSDQSSTQQLQYELRRMSVAPSHQRNKLAKRLVSTMEQNVVLQATASAKKTRNISVFLTCTNAQIGAMKLYSGCGYERTHLLAPATFPLYLRLCGMRLCRYERTLQDQTSS